ncbi:MAG: 30S ribosome-binding factor RbfA [Owenweeksia sp.]|nr:30S ribosome-binding factor RbfA [Owenweeksia sp.]
MQSNRIKKVEEQFKKDLAEIFRQMAQARFKGLLLSVTNVQLTPDLSLARVYVSVFPAKDKQQIIDWLDEHKGSIKNELVKMLKGQLRKMPELVFYLDDAIDQEAEIERILKGGGDSPIK